MRLVILIRLSLPVTYKDLPGVVSCLLQPQAMMRRAGPHFYRFTMPPIKKKPPCKACGGTGKNSKGNLCAACVTNSAITANQVTKDGTERQAARKRPTLF